MLISMNRCIKRIVPKDVYARITYTEHRLNTRFQIEDKTEQIHKYYLSYYVRCQDQLCIQDYLDKNGRRTIESTADHRDKTKHLHLLKHGCNENHKRVDLDNIKFIDSSYHNSRLEKLKIIIIK